MRGWFSVNSKLFPNATFSTHWAGGIVGRRQSIVEKVPWLYIRFGNHTPTADHKRSADLIRVVFKLIDKEDIPMFLRSIRVQD